MLLNNHMSLMDPTPGNTHSIEPGKRVLSSMSPTIVLRDGRPFLALGTLGGKRIFGAVAQAMLIVDKVAGGMNGILVDDNGWLYGAACWRADGVPIWISGGAARPSNSSGVPK